MVTNTYQENNAWTEAVAGMTLIPIVFGAFKNKVNLLPEKFMNNEYALVNVFKNCIGQAVTR